MKQFHGPTGCALVSVIPIVVAVVAGCVPEGGRPGRSGAGGTSGAGGEAAPSSGGAGGGSPAMPDARGSDPADSAPASGGGGAPVLDAAARYDGAGGTAPPVVPDASGGGGAPGGSDAAPGGGLGAPIGDGLTQLLVSSGIGLGYYHACHILETGKVRCFGTADPRNRPPADVAAASGMTQIFCAHNGCCALLPPSSAKRLSCWSHKATFYPPATGVDPIHFGIGYDHGCAINKDHSVRCWGQGRGPQVAAPAGMKAKSLAVASFFNCAVLMDDSVQCWGIKAPAPPPGLKAKLVAAIYHGNLRADMDDLTQGTSHACAVQLDDTLACWGDNIEGTTNVPADLGKVRDVAVASWNTCALKLDGEPVCWGTKRYNSSPERFHPQPPGLRLKSIRAKLATYCGLRPDNTMACWGDEANVHITIEPPTTKFYSP
jgi:hypothetical protein